MDNADQFKMWPGLQFNLWPGAIGHFSGQLDSFWKAYQLGLPNMQENSSDAGWGQSHQSRTALRDTFQTVQLTHASSEQFYVPLTVCDLCHTLHMQHRLVQDHFSLQEGTDLQWALCSGPLYT